MIFEGDSKCKKLVNERMFVIDGVVHAMYSQCASPLLAGNPSRRIPLLTVLLFYASLVDETVIDGVVVVVVARISLVDESGVGGSPVDEFFWLEPKGDFFLGRLDRI